MVGFGEKCKHLTAVFAEVLGESLVGGKFVVGNDEVFEPLPKSVNFSVKANFRERVASIAKGERFEE